MSRRVLPGLAATAVQKITSQRNAISHAIPTASRAVTARSWATSLATARNLRTGQRFSARTARSLDTLSRSDTPCFLRVRILILHSAARPLLPTEMLWVEVVLLKLLVTGQLETTTLLLVEGKLLGEATLVVVVAGRALHHSVLLDTRSR